MFIMSNLLRRPQLKQRMSLSTISIDKYMSRSWLRQHLYYLGFDLIRLQSYQKLSRRIGTNAGGMIKTLVSDISTFINRELNETPSNIETSSKLKELMYLYDNSMVHQLEEYNNIAECRRFFMIVGYMILNKTNREVDELTDRLIQIYLESKGYLFTGSSNLEDPMTRTVIDLANKYYDSCSVRTDKLYHSKPRSLNLFVTKHIKIDLPPLPRIYNKRMLVRSLVHKELYRGFIMEGHPFRKILDVNGINLREAAQILRTDLSFYDGLGDYYLSQESSNLLYHFKHSDPYMHETSFGRKSYTLLKTILATNTLLSRLALVYNLHDGLNDDIINGIFRESYVPYLNDWKDLDFDTCQESKDFRYEQEFIADYFEQYVGTLFLEQPNVAETWINQIYLNILFLISDEHRIPSRIQHQYDYHSWGVDVIGRRLK